MAISAFIKNDILYFPNAEKDRSHSAEDTGKVHKICIKTKRFG